jgi:hypothetical protein
VHATPLEGGAEHATGGGTQSLVVIGYDEPHATQAAISQGAQEVGPECLRLGRSGGDAQHLALDLGLDPERVSERFRDYWRGRPGAGGLKVDWSATWRNWCREDVSRRESARRSTEGRRSDGSQDPAILSLILAQTRGDRNQ